MVSFLQPPLNNLAVTVHELHEANAWVNSAKALETLVAGASSGKRMR
jgi:hypothetical protein